MFLRASILSGTALPALSANMVGPLWSITSSSASAAFCQRGQPADVFAGIHRRNELAAAGKRDRVLELAAPSAQWRQPFLSNTVRSPFGRRGGVSPSAALHLGHGAPAPPHRQARSLSDGRSD